MLDNVKSTFDLRMASLSLHISLKRSNQDLYDKSKLSRKESKKRFQKYLKESSQTAKICQNSVLNDNYNCFYYSVIIAMSVKLSDKLLVINYL